MPVSLNVLLLREGQGNDQRLLQRLRQDFPDLQCTRVAGVTILANHLQPRPDLVLVQHEQGSCSIESVLSCLQHHHAEVPVIVVSDVPGEQAAVECMRAGAADYLLSSDLDRLETAVRRALALWDPEQQQRLRQRTYDPIIEHSLNMIGYAGFDGRFRWMNQAWEVASGFSLQELQSFPYAELVHPEDLPAFGAAMERLRQGQSVASIEMRGRNKDGSYRSILWTATPDAARQGFYCSGHDITDRKRAESSLLHSQRLLAEAYAIARIGYWEWDLITDTVTWSKEMHEIYGVAPEVFDGRMETAIRLVHPDDRQRNESRMAKVPSLRRGDLAADLPLSEEFRLLRADGAERVILERAQLEFDASGNAVRMVGTDQDITEQKLTSRRLLARHAVTQILAESRSFAQAVPRCLWCIMIHLGFDCAELWRRSDGTGPLALALSRHLPSVPAGLSDPEISPLEFEVGVGLPGGAWQTRDVMWMRDVADDPGFQRSRLALERSLRGGIALPIVTGGEVAAVMVFYSRHVQEADEKLHLLLRTFGIQLGQLIERQTTATELELRQRAIEASAEGIIISDPAQPDNPVIYVNPAAERITGYRRDQFLGRNCRFLQGPATDPTALQRIRDCLASDQPVHVELLNYRADGTPFWNSLSITPTCGPDGEFTNHVGFISDVTERKKLEEQYLQSQKMESIGRLAGGVAHDFNNLLTVIMGCGELLLEQLDPTDDRSELAREIHTTARRAAGLTRQLLAFSRRQKLEPVLIDLNELIIDAKKLLTRLIGEDVELVTSLDARPAQVRADPQQISQIVMNLAVNARDAMPDGGLLTVATRNQPVTSQQAAAQIIPPGHYVLLSVTDTGCGMSADLQAKIFEPFFTTKSKGKGTGMGLATVFGIVQQSGGHIRCDSALNEGTTFTVYLPAAAATADDDAAPPPVPEGRQGGGETILLVEDEPAVRRTTARVLRRQGYRVLQAPRGSEALRILQSAKTPVHLLLTDVVMPELSGPQLAAQVLERWPDVRLLFMSGYLDDTIERHRMVEQYPLLVKPFSRQTLIANVEAALENSSQRPLPAAPA